MYPTLSFYSRTPATVTHPVRGDIYWTCFQFAYNGPVVHRAHKDGRPSEPLDVQRFNPEVQRTDRADGTESNEFLAVQKFKHRPVVVLSSVGDIYAGPMQERWQGGQHVLVAPLYSVWDATTKKYKVSDAFLLNVIRYNYASTFFLPGSNEYGVAPSIARFEYTQAVHTTWLRKTGAGVSLSPTAHQFLDEWFGYFLTGTTSEAFTKELADFREYFDQEGSVTVVQTYFPEGLFDD